MWSFSRARSNARESSKLSDGNVLIYIHKEEALADVERRYPAEHYVMVDDKLRILTAVKKAWGSPCDHGLSPARSVMDVTRRSSLNTRLRT